MDEIAVFAGKSHGLAARLVDEGNNFLVDQTTQYHLHDIQRFIIGNAHALNKVALLANFFKRAIDLWAATVHHYGVHPDQLQQRDVFSKILLERHIRHRITAIFDDDILIPEAADVG